MCLVFGLTTSVDNNYYTHHLVICQHRIVILLSLNSEGDFVIIVERIIGLLKEKGITRKEFFGKLHMSVNTLKNWENGTIPNSASLKQIADELGVSPEYLKGEVNERDCSANQAADLSVVNLSPYEIRLIKAYRLADDHAKKYALEMLENHPTTQEKENLA